MADPERLIAVEGLEVHALRGLHIASLRYFASDGDLAAGVRRITGCALPQTPDAVTAAPADGHVILAWRSPTETLLLCADDAEFAALDAALADAADGCMVDQTGGYGVFRVRGARAEDLLLRLGSVTSIPGLNQARTGRVAELTVTTTCVRAGEFLMWVERVHVDHWLGWARATISDL
jgi:sarcosine oxidase gamma subunit